MPQPSRPTAVPVSPVTLSLAARFEAGAADFFWVPDTVGVVARDDIVYAHASDSSDPIFNCVTWVRCRDVAHAETLVSEVSARHIGVSSRWSLASTAPTALLQPALEAHGYVASDVHDLRVLETAVLPPALLEKAAAAPFDVRRVEDQESLLDLYAVTDAAFNRTPFERDRKRLALELATCAPQDSRVARFVAYDTDGRPAAAAGLNSNREFGVGFLWAGGTHPDARGQGAYTALVAARADWARAAGIPHVGVFARVETSSPILSRLGFPAIGRIEFWERPA